MSKLQEEPTQQANQTNQVASLQDKDQQLAEILEEMTHQEQVSVFSQIYLQQVEEVKAQSQEIWHLLTLVKQQEEAIKQLASHKSPTGEPRAMTPHSESQLDIVRNGVFNLIPGMVNTRLGTAVTSYSPTVIPVVNKGSFEDILAKEANFTPTHQPRNVKFMDTVQEALTSTLHTFREEVALSPRPTFQSHLETIWFHMAMQEFHKMQEPKIRKLKAGYTS